MPKPFFKWIDQLTDSAKACCFDNSGNILGLPFWESSVSGCYYNKTLLNELGLRPSVAWPKIIGYSQDDVGAAVLKMFQGETDVEGCVKLMDEYRIAAAREFGADEF